MFYSNNPMNDAIKQVSIFIIYVVVISILATFFIPAFFKLFEFTWNLFGL